MAAISEPGATEGTISREEAVRRLAAELTLLQGVAENLQKQIEVLGRTILELSLTSATLDELEKLGTGKEVLVSIGSGSYITANITNMKTAILNIGAGAAVEKTLPDARETVKSRAASHQDSLDKIREELGRVLERIDVIQPQLQALLQGG